MPLRCPRQSTKHIGRSIGTRLFIQLRHQHSAWVGVHNPAHKIPTDPQPLVSLAAGLGGWAGNTTDKEESV